MMTVQNGDPKSFAPIGQEKVSESETSTTVKLYWLGQRTDLPGKIKPDGLRGIETVTEHKVLRCLRRFTVV